MGPSPVHIRDSTSLRHAPQYKFGPVEARRGASVYNYNYEDPRKAASGSRREPYAVSRLSVETDQDAFIVQNGPPQKRKRTELQEGAFRCDFCSKAFSRSADLVKHKKYHVPESERQYACPQCERRFHFPKDLKRHVNNVHRDVERSVALRPATNTQQRQERDSARTIEDDPGIDPLLKISSFSLSGQESRNVEAPMSVTLNSDRQESPAVEASPYKFEPLRPGNIRLVQLLGTNGNEICCDIKQYALKDAPHYEALSYTWGPSLTPVSIRAGDSRKLEVTPNLHQAFRHLQSNSETRVFWVDAVCIDQANTAEKAAQVQMMSSIYTNASRVCVWLGEHADNSDTAWKLVRTISEHRALPDRSETGSSGDLEIWPHALSKLLNRPWFNRMWILQEIAYARDAVIRCGDAEMSWNTFETALSLLQTDRLKISPYSHQSSAFESDVSLPDRLGEARALRLIQAKSSICRLDGSGSVLGLRFSLTDLMSALWSFECTDLRDRVYALLALAKDGRSLRSGLPLIGGHGGLIENPRASRLQIDNQDRGLSANYQASTLVVYKTVLRLSSQTLQAGNLDILCRPWAAGDALPSWLPNWRDAPFKLSTNEYGIERKNPDPLVGLTSQDGPIYNASSSRPARYGEEWSFLDNGDTDEPHLSVKGFNFDEISDHTDASQKGFIPEDWFKFGEEIEAPVTPADLCRILVADRGPNGSNMPAYYPSAFEYAYCQDIDDGKDSAKLKSDPSMAVAKLSTRIESVVWNRRMLRTTKHKRLGLGPKASRVGDLICILYGMSVPMVLRPQANGTYTLIGECYLHGMMDGQAINVQDPAERLLSPNGAAIQRYGETQSLGEEQRFVLQ